MLDLLWVVVLVLVIAWTFGMATAATMGGLIHVLLVLAIIAIVARLVLGRRVT